MFTGTLIVAIIVALLRKGSFSRLAEFELNRLPFLLISAGLQFLLHALGARGWMVEYAALIHGLSYVALLWMMLGNLQLRGMSLLTAGTILNFLVIAANGGRMPVWARGLELTGQEDMLLLLSADQSLTHQLMGDATVLGFLGDTLILPPPYPLPQVISIGDVIMALGLFILIQAAMVPPRFSRLLPLRRR